MFCAPTCSLRIDLIYVFWWWRMSPMGTECAKNKRTSNLNSTANRRITMRNRDRGPLLPASVVDSCCHGPPRGRASSSGGRRTKPSPNKGRCPGRCYRRSRPHVICPHPSATSTSVRSFGSVSLSAASSPPTSASYVVSVRHLVGLGEKMSG